MRISLFKAMRKLLFVVTFFLGALSGQAQEKVMNVQKADGTTAQVRVAELKQISFLTVDEGGQGLQVKTSGGETATVLFETNPVVTVTSGRLTIKPDTGTSLQFEISEIEEILFNTTTGISEMKGFACVLQDGGVLLRGIPDGVKPLVYSIDGRNVAIPSSSGGELRLNRATLGDGIFIVKVGTFVSKIRF